VAAVEEAVAVEGVVVEVVVWAAGIRSRFRLTL
jgi:hypothetical protein